MKIVAQRNGQKVEAVIDEDDWVDFKPIASDETQVGLDISAEMTEDWLAHLQSERKQGVEPLSTRDDLLDWLRVVADKLELTEEDGDDDREGRVY